MVREELVPGGLPVEELDDDINIDDEDDPYSQYFRSVRTETGLEIGLQVTWPSLPAIRLSTCLPSSELAPMFHGTQWAGTRVWRAAIVALEYLLEQHDFPAKTRLVELGCGLGVPGMVLALQKDFHVTLTDMGALVAQLQDNLTRNECFQSKNIAAEALDWSGHGVQHLCRDGTSFDIVLNCDCIYEPLYGTSWKQLLECQEEFLRIRPDTYMLTSVERRKADGADLYLQAMRASPHVQRVEKIEYSKCPVEIELYRAYGKSVKEPDR